MTPAAQPEILELADRAYALVQVDAAKAAELAHQALALARTRRDGVSRAAALHALGWAQADQGDPGALTILRRAVRAAEDAGDARRAALVRRNVSQHLAYRGRTALAVQEIESACAGLTGLDRMRSEVFRIWIYHLDDRAHEVFADAQRALRALRKEGDEAWEAHLAYNRGIVLAELGDHRRARPDLERAADLYEALGLRAAAWDSRLELALLPALGGDPVRSLIELDALDAAETTPFAASWLYLHRAQAFFALRLIPEARVDLARFEAAMQESGRREPLQRARLELARLALAAGDVDTAAAIATRSRRTHLRAQRSLAATSVVLLLGAAIERRAVSRTLLAAGVAAVTELSQSGWWLDALRGRLVVARAALLAGAVPTARRELRAARSLERKGTVADRIELRHVEALCALHDGDTAHAERKLRAGLDLLDEYRSALATSELRATTAGLGVALAEAGLGLAFDTRDASRILTWAERLRGNALRFPAVRPAADPLLRSAHAELRAVERRTRDATDRGRPVAALVARQAQIETQIRRRSRLTEARSGVRLKMPTLREAARTLGDRSLIEFIEHDGDFTAIALTESRLRRFELESADPASELGWLRFALRRLARGGLDTDARAATLATANAAAVSLDRMLVKPFVEGVTTRDIVVVPSGELHALPWGALPSLRHRAVTIAPSLAIWLELEARGRRRRHGRGVLVAGPRLRHARAEVNQLAVLFPEATVLTGREATVEATLAALEGASLAHIACHGRFRSDSPLFSALELADGPLTAYDIQRLRRPPEILVLSACELALSQRHPGNELLGLAAALLGAGTRTIIASVVPVPDAASRRLMLAFHKHLQAGASPAAALAHAQSELRGVRAALAGFVCLGAG